MSNKLQKAKIAVVAGIGIAAPFLAMVAHGQTIPTWDTTSTATVVNAAAGAFKDTFVYVLQVMAPYAIIVGLIVGLVWFFRSLAGRGGH